MRGSIKILAIAILIAMLLAGTFVVPITMALSGKTVKSYSVQSSDEGQNDQGDSSDEGTTDEGQENETIGEEPETGTNETSEEEAVFKALSHPIRRKIVHVIGKNGYATFTSFSKIEPRVGLLYYHLNIMKDLLYQDEKKRYKLSELGKKAYELLISGEDIEEYESSSLKPKTTSSLPGSILTPIVLFESLFRTPNKSFFGSIFLVGSIGLFLSIVQLTPLFLFLAPMKKHLLLFQY